MELAVVTALLGVLLSVGALNLRMALAREEADGWVRGLATEIAAAQQAALTRRTTVSVQFEGSTFWVAAVGGGVLRQDTLPAHMTFGTVRRTLTFDRRGIPDGDLALTVSSTAGRAYSITVEPGTGRVRYGEISP
jgi:Tfp pilus assembly protein FimT